MSHLSRIDRSDPVERRMDVDAALEQRHVDMT